LSFNNLKRGFKSDSEKKALSLREEMGLKHYFPLDAFNLATYLKITVVTPEEFGLDDKSCLDLTQEGSGWSALTINPANPIIIHNGKHAPTRQQSNIMHEIAHIICKHPFPSMNMISDLPIPLRHYNIIFEEEANWLGYNMLLPRKALQWCKSKSMSNSQIADYYNISPELVKMRIQLTGINKQFRY
jgi:Zn-dependent peptidase ImmA (M78 family)|tara:strand:+ start:1599 stop:2159 length:561 start_codon:yes stop_codon:yes gene_type:complete